MATITGASNEKVYNIPRWLGLNEHPDGDTRLKLGEASKMVNWKITRDGNLKRRPGKKLIASIGKGKIAGMWSGLVAGKEVFLAASDNMLWNLYNEDIDEFEQQEIGALYTGKGVSFFPFGGDVYILNGEEYYVYDGEELKTVEGYRPLVAIAISPLAMVDGVLSDAAESGVTTSEYVNRLNAQRRVWISPDGKGNTFQLPEKPIRHLDWVKDLKTGQDVTVKCYCNEELGRVSFFDIPEESTNSYEIGYTATADFREQVTSNLFAELYSGTTDTRVFLYGDGTNRALYSGMDYNGKPRADYFPDQYEVLVGDGNAPITSMIRHYGSLICYKSDSCWSLQHGIVELATSDLTPAIYCVPVNRNKGNAPPGQVRLVDNSPVTAFGSELYKWTNSSYYSSNLTQDERQAERISDPVQRTIKDFDLEQTVIWDDNDHQELYIVYNGKAIVLNYVNGTWYVYDNFDTACMCNFQGELYIGTSDGKVVWLTYEADDDLGETITAEWESGAMDFGADYSRKYSSMMWVGLKPAEGTSVDVCVVTDRKDTFRDKVVSSDKAKVSGQPFMVKTKIKAKKFVYYRLVLQVNDKQPAVTVTNIDFRVRQTGYTK